MRCRRVEQLRQFTHRCGTIFRRGRHRFHDRAFEARVGLTPKRFARLLRFQRVIAHAARGRADWARVAADCGYYDQSHLVHEFRALSGLTPSAYAPRSPGDRNHVILD